jgi:membrane protease YdiL (CAAX protease family)
VSLDSHALPVRALERGDRATDTSPDARRRVFVELTLLWLACLLTMRGVVALQTALQLPGLTLPGGVELRVADLVLAVVPLLFIYGPVVLCRWRGVDSWSYRLAIPAFRDWASWRDALALTAKVSAVLLVPWLVAYHLYQTVVFGRHPGHQWPPDYLTLALYQVFFVAIPEEFFYRGYFQTRLDEVFERRFLVLGTPIGWGAVFAALYFAFGHSLVQFQWWHFATFFPGMVFAWMRERTGGVAAGALFHATCNVLVVSMDTFYGVIPPR